MYGYDNEETEISGAGLETGTHKVMIKSEEQINNDLKPNNPNMLKVVFECVEGGSKGKLFTGYYNHHHKTEQTKNIARADLAKLALATGNIKVNEQQPYKGRVLQIALVPQSSSDFMQIKDYYTEEGDYVVKVRNKKPVLETVANDDFPV